MRFGSGTYVVLGPSQQRKFRGVCVCGGGLLLRRRVRLISHHIAYIRLYIFLYICSDACRKNKVVVNFNYYYYYNPTFSRAISRGVLWPYPLMLYTNILIITRSRGDLIIYHYMFTMMGIPHAYTFFLFAHTMHGMGEQTQYL